jgi:hypothetical protein
MADEIVYAGNLYTETGLTLEAKVYTADGAQVGSDVALTESTITGGIYSGDFPTSQAAGQYIVYIVDTGNTNVYGIDPAFQWDGSAEKTLIDLNDIAAADVLGATVEGSYTLAESMRIQNAVLAGKVSGAGTGTEVFRDISDSKDRVTATVDASGNRSAITLDDT